VTWIGLDVGATWAKAWLVRRAAGGLEAPGEPALERWNVGGFRPLELEAQRAGAPLEHSERAAGAELVRAAAAVVMAVAEGLERAAGLAVATAGPKTEDGRGIALWRRGPRMPALLDDLLELLAGQGFRPEPAPARLFDDGPAAAAGELAAATGALRGVREALLIGPGTGVAEAFVSGGQLAPWPASVARAYDEPMTGTTTFGDAIALREDRDPALSFAALGRLIELRIEQFADLGLPPFERVVIGAKGGELLASEASPGALSSRLPVVASRLYAAAAIGAVALETARR